LLGGKGIIQNQKPFWTSSRSGQKSFRQDYIVQGKKSSVKDVVQSQKFFSGKTVVEGIF
jgi:hypothetical protein